MERSAPPPREEALTIPARDGYPLDALVVAPSAEPRGALVLNGATGVPKAFYRRFARYAAEQGYAALLYDYRGVGGSRPKALRGFGATMRDWGERDMPGALAWLHGRYAGLPLYAVGHSVGGQLLGLMPNHALLSAAALVAVSTGHWRGMPPGFGLYTLAMLRLVFPLTVGAWGYLPARLMGMGEDLPAGVAREWAAWCLHPRYLAGFFGRTVRQHHYDQFRAPLLWLTFADDPIATPRNVPPMQRFYGAATVEARLIRPADVGLGAIGHLGFFREQGRARLWPDALAWLAARGAPAAARA